MKTTLLMPLVLAAGFSTASAATTFTDGDALNSNLTDTDNWSNGIPNTLANVGTINIDAVQNGSQMNYLGDGIVNHTGGTITAANNFNLTTGTWNMSGGAINARFLLANGRTFNLSGGLITLTQNLEIRAWAGGSINVSESGVVDAAIVTDTAMGEAGTMNFVTGWTGSWTQGGFTGDAWKTEFTNADNFLLDGATIDGATFDSTFVVTNGGKTLEMVAVPEPSSAALLGLAGFALILRRRK
jgi:hypothetical protein